MYNNMINNNNSIEIQRQESLKRRWHDSFYTRLLTSPTTTSTSNPTTPAAVAAKASPPLKPPQKKHLGRLDGGGDLILNSVVPSVTVVLEGRTICHRINLQHHNNYNSLAKALRKMFVEIANIQQQQNNNNNNNDDDDDGDDDNESDGKQLDLSNAVPGYIVAYEDFENDLLLAGDLQWKDFVRVAKRIRIMPVKSSSRKQRSTKLFSIV